MACGSCALKKRYKIVLVGNPNVGKTSIFNMFSRKYAEISNYPGTSVAFASTKLHFGELIDSPGIYDISEDSPAAKITKECIEEADVIVNVVNALTLDRDLTLTLQLLNTRKKMVFVVNQVDEAKKRGISIDLEELTRSLNLDVVEAVAVKNIGRYEIMRAIISAVHRHCHCPLLANCCSAARVEDITARCMSSNVVVPPPYQKIDRLLINPIVGWPIAIMILFALFKILGVFISGVVVDHLLASIDRWYVPFVSKIVMAGFGDGMISEILVGEFGVLTMVVQMVFGILFPLIVGFYVFMSALEDSGYIPRLATLANKGYNFLGLNGSAIIPTLLGFGCGAMGTMATRILGSRKERIIVTAMIGICVPCAAQQGIIVAMLASVGNVAVWFIYLGTMLTLMVASGKILGYFFKGSPSKFVESLPPLRIPSLKNCCRKTFHKAKHFLLESLPIFAVSSIVIAVLHRIGMLGRLQSALAPIVENLLHLPKEFADVFVMGIIRRDFASVGVLNMAKEVLTNVQIVTATVVVSLFVPCINAIIVILKEMGWKVALSLWCGTFILSIAVGAALTRILEVCWPYIG
ncbi:MAG: ferrous iron transporter B [Puniceicoccales bacterium]|jgi:ferrous iron transport protein B|nr:ferrous iron transporter B [Puniceicoccales bacterium]